jgi:hypothetical protein
VGDVYVAVRKDILCGLGSGYIRAVCWYLRGRSGVCDVDCMFAMFLKMSRTLKFGGA